MQQPPLIIHSDPLVRVARARAIHDQECGTGAVFVVVDLPRISDALQEAELFGAVRGHFCRPGGGEGLIVRGAGGSCLIEEVTEATEDTVQRLTRYVTTGIIFRLGSERPERCDTRILLGAAERSPALEAIAEQLHARVV